MKSTRWMILLAAALLLVNLACAFIAPSRASVQDMQLSDDSQGTHPTTTFTPNDTFYVHVDLTHAPENTHLAVVWTAVQVDGTAPNTTIRRTETQTGSGVTHFKLGNRILWPTGKYKVDLYLNGQLAREVDFKVD